MMSDCSHHAGAVIYQNLAGGPVVANLFRRELLVTAE